ncbi:MAG: hypothetical protein ACQESG_04460 [Nanobdellota archaeon]
MTHELLQQNISLILKNIGLEPLKNHTTKGHILDVYVGHDGKRFGFICAENQDNLKDVLYGWHSKNEEIGLDGLAVAFYGELADDIAQLAQQLKISQMDAKKTDELLQRSFEEKEKLRGTFFHDIFNISEEEWKKQLEQHKKEQKEKEKELKKQKKEQKKQEKKEKEELQKARKQQTQRSELEELGQELGEGLADEIISEKRKELDHIQNLNRDRIHRLNVIFIIVFSGIASATTMYVALIPDDLVRRAGMLFLSLLLIGFILGGIYYLARKMTEGISRDRVNSLEREIAAYESEEKLLED